MQDIDRPEVPFQPGDDIPSCFARAAEENPNQPAIIFKGRTISMEQLVARINQVANRLVEMGVGKGDRVAFLSLNSVEYVEAFFGALTAGACAVPLPNMASTDALQLMVKDSSPSVLVVSAEKRDLVESFAGSLDLGHPLKLVGFDFEDGPWQSFESWLEGASQESPGVAIDKNDEFNIIYSSGTTGVPKGITHTHGFRKAFTEGLGLIMTLPGMVNLSSTPFYSNTTMVTWLSSMRYGVPTVLMDKFNAREFLELCQEHKVSIAMLVPVQYDRILRVEDFDDFDLSSMVIKMSTSAPLGAAMKQKILDKMPGELVEVYGLTEGGVTTTLFARGFPDKIESVGQPAEGCTIKAINEDGQELPTGKIGELVGRGPVMMKGYLNRDDANQEMLWFDKDGLAYYRSGDIGRVDEDGFVYLLDRKKDVIISGGFNIYPIDLETELIKHENIADAAVIGVPDTNWGETPLAFVALEAGAQEGPEEIREWINSRVGKSQRISQVEILDEIPKSAIGKTLKKELRKPYWE